eukprot:evm.model.NODE_14053_length_24851_cov_29.928293.6
MEVEEVYLKEALGRRWSLEEEERGSSSSSSSIMEEEEEEAGRHWITWIQRVLCSGFRLTCSCRLRDTWPGRK